MTAITDALALAFSDALPTLLAVAVGGAAVRLIIRLVKGAL